MANKKNIPKKTQASVDSIKKAHSIANKNKTVGYSSLDDYVYRKVDNGISIDSILGPDCMSSSAYSGSSKDSVFSYNNKFIGNSAVNKRIIASCQLAYFGYGIVKNVVDLYTDFACSDFEIVHPKKSVKKFFESWAKVTKLKYRLSSIASSLFSSANVFIYRKWSKDIEEELISKIRRSLKVDSVRDRLVVGGEEIEPDLSNFITSAGIGKENAIPLGYSMLNPLQMEIRRNSLNDDPYWVMCLTKDDIAMAGVDVKNSKYIDLGVSDKIPNSIKYSGNSEDYLIEIKIPKSDLFVMQDRKPDWFDWAIPFIWPALKALRFKDCLRGMEIKACEKIVNTVFLFKLGNIEKGRPADDEHFEKLAEMLSIPGQSLNLLWNEDIQAEVLQPDIKNIFDASKHASADKDILTALGIPEVLVGGTGGNYSNSYVAVAAVLEKLQFIQDKLKEFVENEFYLISKALNFSGVPEIKFGDSALTDKKTERSFLMSLLDRGVVSVDTALRSINTTAEEESDKIKMEKELKFEVKGPFTNEDPGGGGIGGRPMGSPDKKDRGKNSKKRDPKGKNLI